VSDHAFLNSAQEMIKQFYEKLLPTQGVYCIGELDRASPKGKQMRHHYAETIDELITKIEGVNNRKHDCYVSPSTFEKYKRAASECVFHKSLFIDFDVGADKAEEGKGYATKEDAVAALDKFLGDDPQLLKNVCSNCIYYSLDSAALWATPAGVGIAIGAAVAPVVASLVCTRTCPNGFSKALGA
jgi:hypothetical protein